MARFERAIISPLLRHYAPPALYAMIFMPMFADAVADTLLPMMLLADAADDMPPRGAPPA